jgi:hypothetical protein
MTAITGYTSGFSSEFLYQSYLVENIRHNHTAEPPLQVYVTATLI